MPADRYYFPRVYPRRGGDRKRLLDQAAGESRDGGVLESATRLVDLLRSWALVRGTSVAVARELTKIHEEVRTGTLADVAGYYGNTPRGRGDGGGADGRVTRRRPEPAGPTSRSGPAHR